LLMACGRQFRFRPDPRIACASNGPELVEGRSRIGYIFRPRMTQEIPLVHGNHAP
jgi:hypothetical protein